MEVDLMPVIMPGLEILFMVLGIILTTLVSWAVKKYADKLGVEETEKMLGHINTMIDSGLALAKKKSLEELKKSSVTFYVENPKIGFVVQYVVKQAPEYMAKLKLDEDRLVALIESKL